MAKIGSDLTKASIVQKHGRTHAVGYADDAIWYEVASSRDMEMDEFPDGEFRKLVAETFDQQATLVVLDDHAVAVGLIADGSITMEYWLWLEMNDAFVLVDTLPTMEF